ncbi:MAG: hypothetical protein H7123_04725 [Thermoleophilia bacterium]|nr:hypothetical protein [Thermoleophilia bacterium]
MGKLPQITALFWALKMAGTTLGETGGDQISEAMHVGYLATFFLFMAIFLIAVTAQVRAGRLIPALYWTVIVATSAAATEMSDFIDRTIGLGPVTGLMIMAAPLALVYTMGRSTGGSFSVTDIKSRKAEVMYWTTILTTNTIGTAVGDGLANSLGIPLSTLLVSIVMGAIIWAYFNTKISRVALFWAAFVMTRPLGATGGDLLWKPHSEGGMALGRINVSLVLITVIVGLVIYATKRLQEQRQLASANPLSSDYGLAPRAN